MRISIYFKIPEDDFTHAYTRLNRENAIDYDRARKFTQYAI